MTKTTTSPTKNSSSRKRRVLWVVPLFVIVITLALIASGLAIFTLSYQNKIYPNTRVGTLDLSGKRVSEATSLLKDTFAEPQEFSVRLAGEQKATLKRSDIDATYNSEETAKRAYNIGRVGSLTQNFIELYRALTIGNQVEAVYSVNTVKLNEATAAITKDLSKPAVDATISLKDDGTLEATNEETGYGVTNETVNAAVRTALATHASEVILEPTILAPTVTKEQAAHGISATQNILAKAPLTLDADGLTTTVDKKTIFSWLTFTVKDVAETTNAPASTTPSTVQSLIRRAFPVATAATRRVLVPEFNQDRIKDYVATFAVGVNRDPQNAELDASDGKIRIIKTHADGKKVNVDQSVATIVEKLQANDSTPQTVSIAVDTVKAEVQETHLTDLGIKELIGTAYTTYHGSPANRIHNIATGARFLDGVIVPKGEEFSTIKSLGRIDGSTGYLPELVIKENRTIPEYGGGLCQVSTTLFRAALNAGLKITERQNHSYRVSYYEPPIGMDATIYFPKPDFRFVNDTPGHILVQSKVEGTKITFEIYGTKDGRVSTVSEPVVTNVQDPPPTIYAETDTLKKGETKQIEKPHPGATSVVTYTVMRDGKEINKQIFRSKYKAWAARYLVGTAE